MIDNTRMSERCTALGNQRKNYVIHSLARKCKNVLFVYRFHTCSDKYAIVRFVRYWGVLVI